MGTVVDLGIRKAADTSFKLGYEESIKKQEYILTTANLSGDQKTKYLAGLGELSGIKEFMGDKASMAFRAHTHTIDTYVYYDRVAIGKDDMREDGQLIRMKAQELGVKFANFPNKLFMHFLKAGSGNTATGGAKTSYPFAGCYDTQTFFSNSHPIYDPDAGVATTNDNIVSGTGVDTVAHIQADFESAKQAYYALRQRDGEPMFDSLPKLDIWAPAAKENLFNQSFNLPVYLATNLPNPYYGQANLHLSTNLDTSTPFRVNGTSGTYSMNNWFVTLPAAAKPFMFYTVQGVELQWSDKDLLDKRIWIYDGEVRYNFAYIAWQYAQMIYNA